MMIDGSTRLLGILGQNIGYTLSCNIHNNAIRLLKKNNLYVPFDMTGSAVEAFCNSFWHMGGVGFNVTTPHKEAVAKLVHCQNFKYSINTVFRTHGDSWWQGASTDGEGFAKALLHLGYSLPSFRKIIILGNGGAAIAILEYLRLEVPSPPKIAVLRRTPKKDRLIRELIPPGNAIKLLEFKPELFEQEIRDRGEDTLIIQTTSAPLWGNPLLEFAAKLEKYRGVVTDIVYGKPSSLITRAEKLGLANMDGVAMLIEQARLSQKLWFQSTVPYETLLSLLCGKQDASDKL